MIDSALLRSVMEQQDLTFSEELCEKLDLYAKMLVEWNEKCNLTAITAPDEIVVKHFADSLLLTKAVDLPRNSTLIDVGTGAGFPSVPTALYRPDLKVTLLDSLNKRVNFLQELTGALGVDAACVHGRAEDFGQDPAYREKFDFATARAVANLRALSEYCLPFVRVGGYFVALKGYEIEEELEEASFAIGRLGGKIERVEKFELGEEARRSIIMIKKVRQTAPKYPRSAAKMKKSPLIPR